ncbi:hypothetical protein BJ138DRAFT_1018986, partial [Hygrophoropsis aurantiaca]
MVSAELLSQVSERICQAKSWDDDAKLLPFGGVNIIFAGDMGQLKPVAAHALYSYGLVSKLGNQAKESLTGQSAMHGAYLWRLVTKVVELKKNIRSQS